MKEIYKNCDFIPTIGGRGERHLHGLVGKFWRIKDPQTVRIGNCFLNGRLKKDDLFLCTRHAGDCFQYYIFIEEFSNGIKSHPQYNFGSYGIGDAEEVVMEWILHKDFKELLLQRESILLNYKPLFREAKAILGQLNSKN